MEQLIFFGLLIFFSIVESIARSRKQRKGGGPHPDLPPEAEREVESQRQRQPPRRPPVQRPRTTIPPSYDEDESFDARLPADEARSLEVESYDQVAASEAERRRREASSEAMIPSDIWEEIVGLAREAKAELPAPPQRLPPPQPRHVPRPGRPAAKPPARTRPPAPPTPARAPRVPGRRPEVEGTASHPVHRSHVGYGTDPSERAPSAQDAPSLVPTANADATAVRLQLRSKKAHALRQAVILQEVLGPPAATKRDRFGE